MEICTIGNTLLLKRHALALPRLISVRGAQHLESAFSSHHITSVVLHSLSYW
jgi:hypothetical protein